MSLEAHFSMRQWSCFVKRRRRKWKKDLKQSWLPAFWKKDQRHTKGYTEFSLIKQNKRGCHFSDVLYSYIFLLFVKICQGIRLRISAWHDMIHDKAVQTFSKNAFFKAEQSSLYWWYVSRRWAMLIDPSSSSFFFWGGCFFDDVRHADSPIWYPFRIIKVSESLGKMIRHFEGFESL